MKYSIKIKYIPCLSAVLLVFTAFLITGCNDDNEPDQDPEEVSYVSLYHASPDGPSLDILMENNQINFYPLQCTDYTGYLNFYSGERNMRVSPANASNAIIDTTFTFTDGAAYSLFYVNQFNNIEALLIEDELAEPEEGNSAIRFIHLSPDVSNVDLIRVMDGSSTSIAEDNAYLQASEFTMVQSGIQSYQIRSAGTDEVLLSIPDLNLVSGGVYTLVVRGFDSPPPGNTNNLSAQILVNN